MKWPLGQLQHRHQIPVKNRQCFGSLTTVVASVSTNRDEGDQPVALLRCYRSFDNSCNLICIVEFIVSHLPPT